MPVKFPEILSGWPRHHLSAVSWELFRILSMLPRWQLRAFAEILPSQFLIPTLIRRTVDENPEKR
jgi:hypothetical protein